MSLFDNLRTMPMSPSYIDALLSGDKTFTIRASDKYDFAVNEFILVGFGEKYRRILAKYKGKTVLKFGELDGNYQSELLQFYPTLSSESDVYWHDFYVIGYYDEWA